MAERITAEEVKLAEAARFVARPVTVASARRVWRPLVELADEHEARALIVGSHGVSGVTSARWAASLTPSSFIPDDR